ncbi:MAG: DUF4290 domain-containing protein [Bacteroidetes bacterium]|nr:DUF4290 domain-containing protein [Bacteroidota bacterium]
MEYNTQRADLTIAEYGRSIQEMVELAVALEDREERTKAAKTIVNAMAILNPTLKEFVDYKHKLWDHLFIISDFKLDCDSPFPMPDQDLTHVRPDPLTYPQKNIKLRHYGSIIESMIKEAVLMEDSPEKQQVVETIANFMKMSYLTWNRDSVDDEVIREQLNEFSGGKLILRDDLKLTTRFIDLRESDRRAIRNKNQKKRSNYNGGYSRGK